VSDRLIGLLLLAVCATFYALSTQVRRPTFAAFESLGAESFPRLVVVLLALLSVALVIRGSGPVLRPVGPADLRIWWDRYRIPVIALGLFLVYANLVSPIGWYAATATYLVVMQLVLNPRMGRALVYVLAGSVIFTYALGQVFERFLHIVLPKALLF
jgi:hypothetical protein